MKNISLKVRIAIITFVISVALVSVWIISERQKFVAPEIPVVAEEVISDESEKYAVYSAALNEVFAKDKYQTLIIFDKTLESDSPEKLKPNFNIAINYILANEDEYKKRVFPNTDFIDKQPKPHTSISLSRISFNAEKTAAVLHIESTYCPLCGYGKEISLERLQGVWKIKNISKTWVS
jgi:hypothetical protein